ncbi:MAG: hypothetical protein ACLUNO_11775 [Oscillospiraceae bacterium]
MVEPLRETLFETAAGADEELMEKYFEDMMLSEEDTVKGLRQGLKDRTVFPVLLRRRRQRHRHRGRAAGDRRLRARPGRSWRGRHG